MNYLLLSLLISRSLLSHKTTPRDESRFARGGNARKIKNNYKRLSFTLTRAQSRKRARRAADLAAADLAAVI